MSRAARTSSAMPRSRSIVVSKPLRANLLVGDLVIALIGVSADLGEMEVIIDVLEDLASDVFLSEIHRLMADVIDVILHLIPALECEDERAGHVADMHEGPLEAAFVDDQVVVVNGLVGEVVGHQVQPHPVADAERRGETIGDAVARVEHHLFGLGLGLAVECDRCAGVSSLQT